MKLYYARGTCALAPHIVAREAGIGIDLEKVDLKTKKTASGQDYLAINPKGYVPALELDDGSVLTEVPAVTQFLADRKPESKLAPANGTIERYRLQEMLGYINSEIHKSYSPFFNPKTPEETRQERLEYLRKRYAYVEQTLGGKQFLFGDTFTVADAYLFVVTRWSQVVKLDLSDYRNVLAFQKRVALRPGVQTALREEEPSG
jgi:glutathione S-transferase